jgi:hypothetical protein
MGPGGAHVPPLKVRIVGEMAGLDSHLTFTNTDSLRQPPLGSTFPVPCPLKATPPIVTDKPLASAAAPAQAWDGTVVVVVDVEVVVVVVGG